MSLAVALALSVAPPLAAQTEWRAGPSTRGTAEVVLTPAGALVGDATPPRLIRVDYGQPHLRGRTLHTDSLVPYDQSWRLGANAATTLRTDLALTLGGVPLDPGTYVLEALPTRGPWFLVIHRIAGTNAEGENVLAEVGRASLTRRTRTESLESLSMWLIPSREPGPASGELRFAWGMGELATAWRVR
jgi:hypothetical protein